MTSSLPRSAQKDLERAVSLFQQGRLVTAEGFCGELFARFPGDAELAHIAGVLATRMGKFGLAVERLRRSVRLEPGLSDAHNGLGIACFRLGFLDEALASFGRALALAPESVETRLNAARALLQAERADALHLIALGLQQAGDLESAATAFARLLELAPGDGMARGQYSLVLDALGRAGEAHAEIEHALATPPIMPSLHNARGVRLLHRSQWGEAAETFRLVLAAEPLHAEARINLALALREMGHRDEALHDMATAEGQGNLDPLVLARLASMHGGQGDSAKAISLSKSALAAGPLLPDAHVSLAAEFLRSGELARGWQEYLFRPTRGPAILEQIARGAYPPRLPATIAGADIVLLGEQGIGDTLFFLRYAKALADAGARLHLRVDRRLQNLLERALPIASWLEGEELPHGGIALWMGDLPFFAHALITEPVPTLRIEPHGQTVISKEIEPALLGASLKGAAARVVSLQREPVAGSREALEKALAAPTADFSDVNGDLEDMLALLALLDGYVGVSSTNIHLLAAVGKGGRVLVPYPADWRWCSSDAESPWFPGFPTYRQERGGDWSAPLAQLAQDLKPGGVP